MLDLCSSIHSLVFLEGHQLVLSEAPLKHSLGKGSLGPLSKGSMNVTVPSSAVCQSPFPRLPLQPLKNLLPSLPKKCHMWLTVLQYGNPCGRPHPKLEKCTEMAQKHQQSLTGGSEDTTQSRGLYLMICSALRSWFYNTWR